MLARLALFVRPPPYTAPPPQLHPQGRNLRRKYAKPTIRYRRSDMTCPQSADGDNYRWPSLSSRSFSAGSRRSNRATRPNVFWPTRKPAIEGRFSHSTSWRRFAPSGWQYCPMCQASIASAHKPAPLAKREEEALCESVIARTNLSHKLKSHPGNTPPSAQK